ncbi:hypothetical protein cypCar_00006683 [Cyprinus carpio]|nr:hypothetical protein cypCar_00006683 [Cyprinus carpio]
MVCKCEELFTNNTHRNLAIQFHLECSYTCLTYYEYRRAKEHLQTARSLSGIDVNMIATPQELLPKDHQLSDDTVLNQINLAEPSEHELPDLNAEEQALILATCIDFQKNNPVHKLNDEELLAFTTVRRTFFCLSLTATVQLTHLLSVHAVVFTDCQTGCM